MGSECCDYNDIGYGAVRFAVISAYFQNNDTFENRHIVYTSRDLYILNHRCEGMSVLFSQGLLF